MVVYHIDSNVPYSYKMTLEENVDITMQCMVSTRHCIIYIIYMLNYLIQVIFTKILVMFDTQFLPIAVLYILKFDLNIMQVLKHYYLVPKNPM